MHVRFIAPAGGHRFCNRFAAGLRAIGHSAEVVADTQPPPPATDGTLIVDAASLAAIEPPPATAAALVHDAPSSVARRLAAVPLLIATGEAMAARLAEEFEIPPRRIRVVAPGLPDLPRSPGSGGPRCHVLSIGPLVRRKGPDLLLRALARLFDLDWGLSVVGDHRDPEFAAELSALVSTLGIKGAMAFIPSIGEAALDKLWATADLFALASRWEGYPAMVAEALRRGVPVALTAEGEAARFVPAEGGAVCAPEDYEGLSKAMRRLIFDPELRRRFADHAWEAGQRLPDLASAARTLLQALEAPA